MRCNGVNSPLTPSMHRADNFQGLGVIRPSVIQKCTNLCIRPPILPSEGTLPAPKFRPSRRFVSHSHRQVGPVNQSSITFDQFQNLRQFHNRTRHRFPHHDVFPLNSPRNKRLIPDRFVAYVVLNMPAQCFKFCNNLCLPKVLGFAS